MTVGEEEEMTRFVADQFSRLVNALDLYVGSVQVAEELAQEALLRACTSWDRVRVLESPGGWTYRVAINLATSHLRRRQAEARARRRLGNSSPGHDAIDSADRIAVRDAVLALPDQQRAAVIARYFLGMTAVEYAAALGSTPEAVRTATSRAVAALRVGLGPKIAIELGEEHADA